MHQMSLFDPAPPHTGPNAPLTAPEHAALAHYGIHVEPGGAEEGRGVWYRTDGTYWPELGADDLRLELQWAEMVSRPPAPVEPAYGDVLAAGELAALAARGWVVERAEGDRVRMSGEWRTVSGWREELR